MPVKKKPSPAQLAARAKFVAMVKARAAAKKKAAPKKVAVKKVSGLDKVTRKGKKTTVSYSRIGSINDSIRKELTYGAIYDTSLQLYLVKFANLSFSLWAVTSEGLKKALNHPEGKFQAPIVYRVKNWGIPKFEKMKVSELKEYK
jgi:hypothetical protein